MTARANWHLDLPEDAVPKVDPLDSPLLTLMAIDVKTPEPKLEGMLSDLLARERSLFEAGISCDLREMAETTCSACPLFGEGKRAPLCSVGREQEQVSATLMVKLHGR